MRAGLPSLVLVPLVMTACTGGPNVANSPTDVVAPTTTQSSTAHGPDKEFLRHRTDLEIFVIHVVRGAGASRVRVAEPAHGDPDADIWGRWMGKEIFVQGYPTAAKDSDYRVLQELEVEGLKVLEAKEFGRRKLIVECQEHTYEMSKSLDDRWDNALMMGLAAAVAHSAGC